eukprot:667869-Amphidinium_carterae.2
MKLIHHAPSSVRLLLYDPELAQSKYSSESQSDPAKALKRSSHVCCQSCSRQLDRLKTGINTVKEQQV